MADDREAIAQAITEATRRVENESGGILVAGNLTLADAVLPFVAAARAAGRQEERDKIGSDKDAMAVYNAERAEMQRREHIAEGVRLAADAIKALHDTRENYSVGTPWQRGYFVAVDEALAALVGIRKERGET